MMEDSSRQVFLPSQSCLELFSLPAARASRQHDVRRGGHGGAPPTWTRWPRRSRTRPPFSGASRLRTRTRTCTCRAGPEIRPTASRPTSRRVKRRPRADCPRRACASPCTRWRGRRGLQRAHVHEQVPGRAPDVPHAALGAVPAKRQAHFAGVLRPRGGSRARVRPHDGVVRVARAGQPRRRERRPPS